MADDDAHKLHELRGAVVQGLKATGQLSYRRRGPNKESIPFLLHTITRLQEYIHRIPEDGEAWRLLSLAEEALLNFGAAAAWLRRVGQLSGLDRKDKKRLARLEEYKKDWIKLGLTPNELSSLGEHLAGHLRVEASRRDLRFTEEWLRANVPVRCQEVLDALQSRGAFSDFLVFHNVV